jgi:hypothetical protein
MKVIGNQLIEGISVNENGKIVLDSTRINPNVLRVKD